MFACIDRHTGLREKLSSPLFLSLSSLLSTTCSRPCRDAAVDNTLKKLVDLLSRRVTCSESPEN